MMWCMVSMVLGALIFATGVAFEKLANADRLTVEDEPEMDEFNQRLYRQWGNLLDYDGTEQEDISYDE